MFCNVTVILHPYCLAQKQKVLGCLGFKEVFGVRAALLTCKHLTHPGIPQHV